MFEDEQLDAELLLRHVQEPRQLGHGHGGVELQEAAGTGIRPTAPTETSTEPEGGGACLPADGGELSLLLYLLSKHLQLLLERLFVVVGVHVVVVWNHRGQELGTGEAEELLKHLQVSEEQISSNII